MATPKYKVGDVVVLNSGGPAMTVRGYGDTMVYESGGISLRAYMEKGDKVVVDWFNPTAFDFTLDAFEEGEVTLTKDGTEIYEADECLRVPTTSEEEDDPG